jgi:hypothetical protein
LINYTHPDQELAEILIPALKKFGGLHEIKTLNEANTTRVWGRIKTPIEPTSGIKEIWPNGGIAYDGKTETLYWTWSHPYYTGGPVPTFAATSLSNSTPLQPLGHWIVNDQKHHWGGPSWIGKDFADQFLGGKRLGLGFGGYYSICAGCSRGPAFSAVDTPNPSRDRLDLIPLMNYSNARPAPRDGEYLVANISFWNDQPASRKKGFWTAFDSCRSAVFVELKHVAGYISFISLGTGRVGYDNGAGTAAGGALWWYIYSAADFAEMSEGKTDPFLIPVATISEKSFDPGPASLLGSDSGACFDAENQLLYVVRSQAYLDGKEYFPIVNVYRVLDRP